MNALVKEQLKKCKVAQVPNFTDEDTEILIPMKMPEPEPQLNMRKANQTKTMTSTSTSLEQLPTRILMVTQLKVHLKVRKPTLKLLTSPEPKLLTV